MSVKIRYENLTPELNVTLAGTPIGRIVSGFTVTSALREKADTCVLKLADYGRILTGSIKRGDPLKIKWGYAGEELTEIFRGVIRSVGVDDPVIIRGIDYNAILNSQNIRMTFEDETASGIVKAVMAGSGLGLDIEDCDIVIDRLPLFNRSLREAVDAVTKIVKRESGEQYCDYIREGTLHWCTKKMDSEAQRAFRMGVTIVRQEIVSDGLEFIETLVSPVKHSEIIEVEGKRQFVVKVEYLWDEGGRTRIWYEHAG